MAIDERINRAFRQTPRPNGLNDASDPTEPVKTPATPGVVGSDDEIATKENQELQASLKKVQKMIEGGRAVVFVSAAKHLEHWRNGSGIKTDHAGISIREPEIWLKKKVWPKFVPGANKRFKIWRIERGGFRVHALD
ncbi:hypothetical protein LOC67_17130 [Stieleria sp. JC731]|uniref:hypothetical protein n=1 Tax=Pirellulaceae TaxID=2691357 RepID=UPI001E4A60B1|nr:hypothetical protein [Stieleria sp. JC731]MCC9602280.1 hypothetical protein [Stieleria sp. JC731]